MISLVDLDHFFHRPTFVCCKLTKIYCSLTFSVESRQCMELFELRHVYPILSFDFANHDDTLGL